MLSGLFLTQRFYKNRVKKLLKSVYFTKKKIQEIGGKSLVSNNKGALISISLMHSLLFAKLDYIQPGWRNKDQDYCDRLLFYINIL